MADLAYAQFGNGGGPGPLVQFLPLALVFLVFYFLLIRPQQQKAKAHRETIDNLKRNDEVVTTGGLYGRVIELNDKVVTLEIAPNVRVRVDRPHIDTLVGGAKPGKGSGSESREGKEK
ncbi:MAG: preprotein translocase subunit YajC [Deltaproteobacteria bacterium]|nr:preprotein translocase subunit YajC [Deltaproteobacteria bacterium]